MSDITNICDMIRRNKDLCVARADNSPSVYVGHGGLMLLVEELEAARRENKKLWEYKEKLATLLGDAGQRGI